jgi:predicted nucleic acid-binding protein
MISAVSWLAIPELADRIIAATAVALNFPLITKDARIQSANIVTTIW